MKQLHVMINRTAPPVALEPFTDYFKGFEKVEAVRSVFGEKTESILENLKIAFVSFRRMYMGVRYSDGNLTIGTYHLKNSDLRILYLDVVHELFHVRQFFKDKKYFQAEFLKFIQDRSLYYASPIEIPAYAHAVREAERIGMGREEITEYLKMGPTPPKVFQTFLKYMELKSSISGRILRLNVEINRNPRIHMYPFSDYFKGFENVDVVRALFGKKTDSTLRKVRIEFVDFPFMSIFPSEDDGHFVISRDHLRKSSITSLYLDVILCLNFLRRMSGEKVQSDFWEEADIASNPLVLDSYKAMIDEAGRIGLSNAKILQRLELPRFLMSPEKYGKFVGGLGVG